MIQRYAGFDPDEDNFDGVKPAALHRQDYRGAQRSGAAAPPRKARTRIDIERAWQLKRAGNSWDQVGRIVAREAGRPVAYRGTSIRRAALYAERVGA